MLTIIQFDKSIIYFKVTTTLFALFFILTPLVSIFAQEAIPIPGETQSQALTNPDTPMPGEGIVSVTLPISSNSVSKSAEDVTTTTIYPSKFYNTDGIITTKHIFANGVEVGTVTGTGSDSVPRYVHTDQLTSSNISTNSSDTIDETLDYFPFGGIRIDSGPYNNQRKFIDQEYDMNTRLNYLNARYYDPNMGKFISGDPSFWQTLPELLIDPQQQNSYSYARNNPIKLSDPSGLLTVVVPGTDYNKNDWSPSGKAKDFIASVGKTFNETPKILDWSGGNTKGARENAVASLVEMIKNHSFGQREKLNIVGHSHGGNVAILASQRADRKIDTLVTLGTPVRPEYQPNYDMIGTHINAYSYLDPVQTGGGQAFAIGGLIGIGINSILGPSLSIGFVPAGRKFDEAENINVTLQAGFIGVHTNLWQYPSVWSKVNDYINK